MRLTVEALLEVVESGAKNIEIMVMKKGEGLREVSNEDIAALAKEINEEKEKEKEKAGENRE